MLHARADYNRFQDPALLDPSLLAPGCRPIAEDEPVFILRAQDAIAPAVLRQYAFITSRQEGGGDQAMIQVVSEWAVKMERWQAANPGKVKRADLPTDAAADNARQQAGA